MMIKSNMILSGIALGVSLLLFACDDPSPAKKPALQKVVTKKISQPPAKSKKSTTGGVESAKKTTVPSAKAISDKKVDKPVVENHVGKESLDEEHYDPKGKTDPFKPLIQEKPVEAVAVADKRPKRILTPLEKIELSQIRLVAIIIMENRQLAMVEDATGKGYEVGIGTYIGKNQGRVFKIEESSIAVKELVRDFKGRLREKIQEIKLHKNDSED